MGFGLALYYNFIYLTRILHPELYWMDISLTLKKSIYAQQSNLNNIAIF